MAHLGDKRIQSREDLSAFEAEMTLDQRQFSTFALFCTEHDFGFDGVLARLKPQFQILVNQINRLVAIDPVPKLREQQF